MINSKLTGLLRGAARAGSTRKKNVSDTQGHDMARHERELGRLEEGLRHIKDTLDKHDSSRRQLYEKVDQIDTKVTKMEPRIEQIERRIGDLQPSVQQFQAQQNEAAGVRKFSRLVWVVLGAIGGALLSSVQFVKALF